MKHFLLILSLLLLPFMLFASNDDLYKSKGTTQDVIVHLTPSPVQEDVSRYVKIEVTFNVSLDAPAIKEYDVKLTYLSSKTNDHIAGTISYSETDKKLTFTPKTSLEPGMYEVEIESLKADKAHKEIKIDELMYRFVVVNEVLQSMTINPNSIELKETESIQLEVTGHYDTGAEKNITTQVQWSVSDSQIVTVDANNATLKALKEGTTSVTAKMESIETNMTIVVYKEINGHRLPPEPDSQVNNSTLLGIDLNDNGVRDDVERYIIIEEAKNPNFPKTQTAISLQYVWAWQKMIESPTIERRAYLEKASACQEYFIDKHTKGMGFQDYLKWQEEYASRLGVELEDKIFNTKERIIQRFKFNEACSGHIFNSRKTELNACQTNIDALGE